MNWMLALLLTMTMMQPLTGSATWYSDCTNPGCYMKNGQVYDPDALTCAVDVLMYADLVGKTALVCAGDRCVPCEVSDSGYLADAIDPVLVDLTPRAFRALRAYDVNDNDGRLPVTVWVIP